MKPTSNKQQTNKHTEKPSNADTKQLQKGGLDDDPAAFVKKSLLSKLANQQPDIHHHLPTTSAVDTKNDLKKKNYKKPGFKPAYTPEIEKNLFLSEKKKDPIVFYEEINEKYITDHMETYKIQLNQLEKRKLAEDTIKKIKEGNLDKKQKENDYYNENKEKFEIIKDILTPINNFSNNGKDLNEKLDENNEFNSNIVMPLKKSFIYGAKDELGHYIPKKEGIDIVQQLEIARILEEDDLTGFYEPDFQDNDPFFAEKPKPIQIDLSNDNIYILLSKIFKNSAMLRRGGEDLVKYTTLWYKEHGKNYLSSVIYSFPDLSKLVAINGNDTFMMKQGIFTKIEKNEFLCFINHNIAAIFSEMVRILRKIPSLWFMAQEIEKLYKNYISDARLPTGTITNLCSYLTRPNFKSEINKRFGFLPMETYILNLEKQLVEKIKYIDSESCFDWKLNYDLIEDIDTFRIESLLNSMIPDTESLDWLVSILGNALSGQLPPPYVIFLYGLGKNGKSVLCDLLRYVFGQKCYMLPSEYLSKKNPNTEGPSPFLIGLEKKLITIIPEIENKKIDTTRLKTLIDGNFIMGRDLRSNNPKEFVPQSLFLIQANVTHTFTRNDWAAQRRVLILQFENTFLSRPNPEKENEKPEIPNLKFKLRNDLTWRQEFLFYLIKKRTGISSEQLPIPKKVEEDTLKANRKNESIVSWLPINIEYFPGSCLRRLDIINRFTGQNFDNYQNVPNYTNHIQAIDNFFYICHIEKKFPMLIEEKQKRVEGKRVRGYHDVKFREDKL